MVSRIYEVRSEEEVWAERDTVIYFNKDIHCLRCWAVNTDHNYMRYLQGPTQDGGGETAGLHSTRNLKNANFLETVILNVSRNTQFTCNLTVKSADDCSIGILKNKIRNFGRLKQN
jgi:hypothetical protein